MQRPAGPSASRKLLVLRTGIALLTAGFAAVAFPQTASADATDDYPIPHQMIVTTCSAEQILSAARTSARSTISATSLTSITSRLRFSTPPSTVRTTSTR